MRINHTIAGLWLALVPGCAQVQTTSDSLSDDLLTREERIERLLSVLAADSMQGRRTGTSGSAKAALFLKNELERYGLDPAGEEGFHQNVPLARIQVNGPEGQHERIVLPSNALDFDELPRENIIENEVNVVALIPGSDPAMASEAVIIGAHYDHIGIGAPINGDSIYNGADDDGSGTVAVLEIARDLARNDRPRRTIIILLSTAEEIGLLGTLWYIDNPVFPLSQTVANLQIEMIGRPDSLAGGFGRGWLTGFERTTMGEELIKRGSPIVTDPRPDQNFFFRSDNIAFARIGIPAHTLSSYNLHDDYHMPSDEVQNIDFGHMAAVVEATIEAVRILANGPRPKWVEGGMDGLIGNVP